MSMITNDERARLLRIKGSSVHIDVMFLADILLRLLRDLEQREDYERERP